MEGPLDPAMREKLLEIANTWPVHRTSEAGSAVVTKLADTEYLEME